MYSFESRVRYSETDGELRLAVGSMMNYLQDCSTFQSEDIGRGVRYMEEQKRAWLLASWHIVIDRMPVLGERITVSTWPYAFKGIYGYRNFTIRDAEGEGCVRADSIWFLFDSAAGQPVRVRPEDIRGYGDGSETRLSMPEAPRRIPVPETYTEGAATVVAKHHIDTNHHVNNAKYVEIAREALPERLVPAELRVEYRHAAVLGDVLIPRVTAADGIYTAALCREDGLLCAVVQMR